METLTLNKYDFKKYLLANLSDCRQEELIFWKKSIPLPVDIVYDIYEKRGTLIKKYLDQIATVYLYHYILECKGIDSLSVLGSLPSEKQKAKVDELRKLYKKYEKEAKVSEPLKKVAIKLFIVEYSFSEQDFIDSICHEGRKFKRLYLPADIKDLIKNYNSKILKVIGVSNGDMFGNVVADELGIYRSGFSDAFAAIFNKLLDFILAQTGTKVLQYSTASNIKITQAKEEEPQYSLINYGKVSDGSLWEPKYSEARSSFVINNRHPYFESLNKKSAMEFLNDIARQSSLIENETVKDSIRKVLENYRQELSRQLRLIAERD